MTFLPKCGNCNTSLITDSEKCPWCGWDNSISRIDPYKQWLELKLIGMAEEIKSLRKALLLLADHLDHETDTRKMIKPKVEEVLGE